MARTYFTPSNAIVRAALLEAGWSESRNFCTDDWVAALAADGHDIVKPALEWLSSLGGLTIVPPRRGAAVYGSGELVVDPLWAATGESERLRERGKLIGNSLTPVGEWMGEYILVVADDGKVYAESTFEVLWLGDDVNDALERLIVANTPPVPLDL